MNIILAGEDRAATWKVVQEIVEELEADVGGIRSREDGDAFKIVNLGTGEENLLASEELDDGPTVQDLHVNVDAIDDVSKDAIKDAIRKGHLIIIDRISRIQMHSSTFREGVRDAFRGSEDVIAIVDPDYVDEFEEEGKVVRLTEGNRESTKRQILRMLGEDNS